MVAHRLPPTAPSAEIADRAACESWIEVRVRDALADLVTILVILRRADGTQYNCGLLSMPADEWQHMGQALCAGGIASGRVRMDDDTTVEGA